MNAKKSLGQHFLRCEWVASTIISGAHITKNDTVLEVGPGTGILTKKLARSAKKVIAVEKDETLADTLVAQCAEEGIKNVTVISDDILTFLDQTKFGVGTKIVGNIPYYVTSRLIRTILERDTKPSTVVFTIQKEVAERMVAKPPHMNLLTLSVQAFGKPEIVREVPPKCFRPSPKVTSAIIKISSISDEFFKKTTIPKGLFFKLVRAGFSQKRKKLANALTKTIGKATVLSAIKKTGLSPNTRAQELSLDQWAQLIKNID